MFRLGRSEHDGWRQRQRRRRGADTIPLTQLGATNLVNSTGAAIYYALDEDLPEPGAYTVTLLNNFNGSNALSAHVMELRASSKISSGQITKAPPTRRATTTVAVGRLTSQSR